MMKKFCVSVSRMARGKAGYQRSKTKFGRSFYPEQHTIESLIKLAANDGYSFLAGEFARNPPVFYGRRDVITPRITENFRQTYIIPLDDDGAGPGNSLEFWENDKLFQTFGAGYYHSSSSTPAKPKLRILFELDRSITNGKKYQEARRAFAWYYPRVDELPQIPQVWYGSDPPSGYRILANVLTFEAFERIILTPYRNAIEAQAKAQAAEQERLRQQRANTPASDQVSYIVNWLATRQAGDNRNNCLLWAGGQLKALGETWGSIGAKVVQATMDNGYYEAYAKSDTEIERIFSMGHAL